MLAGCSSYTTPGAAARLGSIVEGDILVRFERAPAAVFPARLAVVRIQGSGYRSYSNDSYGEGRFAVVLKRDVERQEDFERLAGLPAIAGLTPLNRMLLPDRLDTDQDLRFGASSLRADMLLVYTLDTTFHVQESPLRPLTLFYLGLLPDQKTTVRTVTSAALFDVRTGFVYGLAEGSAESRQAGNAWNNAEAVENTRHKVEREAFVRLLDEFERTWRSVVAQHAGERGAT